MIKITFEFESVEEAAKFLKDGSLGKKTNARIGSHAAKPAEPLECATMEEQDDEAKPLTPSERRKAARMGKQGSSKKTGASKKGKGKGKGKKRDSAPVSDDISDADLSKAASAGAEQITPNGVTAILEQFGVSHVSELVGASRREFIDLLDQAMEDAK